MRRKNPPKLETQKVPLGRITVQKLRRLVDQSMTVGIPLQSMGTAGETLNNRSDRDRKASTNGC